jgi:predicted signal transduction protein with EAL and GGDEF domain
LLTMLAGGVWLIRRQHEFATTVSTIVKNVPTPVAVVDLASDRILLANEALLAEFGAMAGAGRPFASLLVDPSIWPEDRKSATGEAIPMFTRDRTRYMQVHCTELEFATKSAPSAALLVALIDVTRQQLLVKKLRSEADSDALTGLANRRHFERVAEEAVAHARQQGNPLSVLALDLDFFKKVNDTYGHAAGDRVLQRVGCSKP